jgi:hypothetical protein
VIEEFFCGSDRQSLTSTSLGMCWFSLSSFGQLDVVPDPESLGRHTISRGEDTRPITYQLIEGMENVCPFGPPLHKSMDKNGISKSKSWKTKCR